MDSPQWWSAAEHHLINVYLSYLRHYCGEMVLDFANVNSSKCPALQTNKKTFRGRNCQLTLPTPRTCRSLQVLSVDVYELY